LYHNECKNSGNFSKNSPGQHVKSCFLRSYEWLPAIDQKNPGNSRNFQKGTPEGKDEYVAFNDFARPTGSMPMQVESGSPLSQSSSSND